MIHILFLIPNLGHGGAEKVLVNLVNNMDRSKYDITVMTLYNEGVNRESLASHIHYKTCFKRSFLGVSHLLKIFSPEFLYRHLVGERYDIVVSYLEGQTARIVSGCKDGTTKKMCWIHRTMTSLEDAARLFRNVEEAKKCYSNFDVIVFVSKDVQAAFMNLFKLDIKGVVAYNTNQTDMILEMSEKVIQTECFAPDEFKICAMGSLYPVKGFDRLLNIHKRLREDGYMVHTYILGEGVEKEQLEKQAKQYGIEASFTLLGYHKNPYAYMKQCDLFVCCSRSEGFSTAVTEALILGIPVVTTKVSGMTELLGENQEYGIVTHNDEESLLQSIVAIMNEQKLLEHYQNQAVIRGKDFMTEKTVEDVQKLFENLWE
ncbi:glycosyltransferase [Faecalicatena contorta]|uniref:glycosyltransferase n=1 Tax=Faecalicatena contorta TaxID=39482 RepID=UPI001F1763C7|nr:glycosyltransferase [Faecalicatena contorta]MCF2682330.1 glycosyltransferase [Faecalicatena contorta]